MATTAARQDDYITQVREAARKVWEGVLELEALQPEWSAQDYGTGTNLVPISGGSNSGIGSAAVGAAVFDTADAIRTLLDTGHATNLTALL